MSGRWDISQHARRLLRRVARRPGRSCVILLVFTIVVGGGFYAIFEHSQEDPPSWFDGMWWAVVTMTTVGYGDYSPHTVAGRWTASFVMAGGIGSVAILTGILADEIRQVRLEEADFTPTLDDDIDQVMAVLAGELDKLRAKVSHPEVVQALKKVQSDILKEVP